MIIDRSNGTYGVVSIDLDDANHENQAYDYEDIHGAYTTITEAALSYTFGQYGFKVHPDLAGKV